MQSIDQLMTPIQVVHYLRHLINFVFIALAALGRMEKRWRENLNKKVRFHSRNISYAIHLCTTNIN